MIPAISRHGHLAKPLFYTLWLLIALLHAGNAGLLDDEAYYWMYARYPAWGYFDHPPLIGAIIRAGYAILPNPLGVRLIVVLMSTATLLGIDRLLDKRDDRLFYMIALSMGVLQVGGIIAVPDIPLMFFVTLFLLAFRRFTTRQGWSETLLLATTMAGMAYAKYHGALVVICSLLAVPRLLTRWQTYAAGLITLALFSPHLLWQAQHDFPSFRYHLFERNAPQYKPEYTTEYLVGQVALAGPLVGWLLIWAAIRHRPASDTEKALRYILLGFYAFFLLNTFKGRVEANWTVPAIVPLIVLSHQWLTDRPRPTRWIRYLFIPSFLLASLVRIYMMADIDPVRGIEKDEFHRNPEWAETIARKADGRAIVIVNSYQRPSQYNFATGGSAFGLTNIFYRRNNYNFWPIEAQLLGKHALVISHEDYNRFNDTIHTPRGYIGSRDVPVYFSFSGVDIRANGKLRSQGLTLETTLHVKIPVAFTTSPQYRNFDTAQIVMAIYRRNKKVAALFPTGARLADVRHGKLPVKVTLPTPYDPGPEPQTWQVKWGVTTAIPGWPSLNSSDYPLEITPIRD
jgi:uncharacterized membrane protein